MVVPVAACSRTTSAMARGPKDRTNIKISHTGSEAQQGGSQESWVARYACSVVSGTLLQVLVKRPCRVLG